MMNHLHARTAVVGLLGLSVLASAAIVVAAPGRQPLRPVPVAKTPAHATSVVAAPGDPAGRLYVVERTGRILVVDRDAPRPRPFLDLRPSAVRLISLAFHPAYAQNRLLYVLYLDRLGRTVVSEFKSDGLHVQPNSGAELLAVEHTKLALTSLTVDSSGNLYALAGNRILYRLAR